MRKAKFYYQDQNAPEPNNPNHIGTCAIIRYKNKILLEYRKDSDFWALIGGGLEINESAEFGMVREIREETGLKVAEESLIFHRLYSDPTRIIHYTDGNTFRPISVAYIVNLDYEHKLICSNESRELKYFRFEEIHKLNIVATHKHIIEEYLSEW